MGCTTCKRRHEFGATPCENEITLALSKILGSSHFADSRICRSHLGYLGEKALRGDCQESFSESDVMVEVVVPNHPDWLDIYDPHVHRVIGVRHCRTKARLRAYYAAEGADDRVEIAFEKGSLQPQFRYRVTELPALPLASAVTHVRVTPERSGLTLKA